MPDRKNWKCSNTKSVKKYKYESKSDYEIKKSLLIFLLSGGSNTNIKHQTQMDMAFILTRFHVFHRHILYFCYWCLQKLFCMWEMKKISFCNMALFCLINWIFVMEILGWKHFKERNYWQNYFTYWSMWGSMRST